ncbi:aminotransferase class I/II-fold pyridoxal phosphate-dependent enzyme [Phytohabitans sp. ZYX-F-186]|uniref:Aminotransferase n=1 Tax=Phytohabitans maris TaxID=3071409 RepID=A0ABU0ZP01_9ACTN|nr:aminotransferase class I/II-fold pyridoxal phosphate-dependent enzyme [Phytohabitans sp. ZYX-F-186]MDQ7908756.1 aminotransferase class I/II-fold pyridoxal phosphate-dependent enzyme [Phytohabitans sp. ZYX-F-186]
MTLSPTAVMRERAAELRSSGRAVIDLSAGELDFPTPGHIVERAASAMTDPANHHYGPSAGLPALRDAIAADASDRFRCEIGRANVTVTNGAKQGIFNTILSVASASDDVLIPAPYWVTFPSAVRIAGATPRIVEPASDSLQVTPAELDDAATAKTAALILASPHNPTGTAYDAETLAAIARWCADRGIWLIYDETYERLRLDGPSMSPAAVYPPILPRLVSIGSVSKAYAMTGWRVGWAISPVSTAKRIVAIQSHTTSNVNQVAQYAALAALEGPDVSAQFRDRLKARHRKTEEILAPLRDTCSVVSGTFYLFLRLPAGFDDVVTAGQILETAGVITMPGSAFGRPGYLRISVAVNDDDLERGVRLINSHLTVGRGQRL